LVVYWDEQENTSFAGGICVMRRRGAGLVRKN
jgi:hypothetical protein